MRRLPDVETTGFVASRQRREPTQVIALIEMQRRLATQHGVLLGCIDRTWRAVLDADKLRDIAHERSKARGRRVTVNDIVVEQLQKLAL